MLIRDLVKELSKTSRDPDMIVTDSNEWIDIINFAAGELSPEVMLKTSSTLTYITDVNQTSYEADLSAYVGIEDVLTVHFVDVNGKQLYYDNWIYDKEQKLLRLDPTSGVSPAIVPSTSHPTIKVEWTSIMADKTGDQDVDLAKDKMNVLKLICLKEALQRVLLDATKYDRYKTLVRKANEYAVLAIIRDYAVQIELAKRKLTNTNQVRTF